MTPREKVQPPPDPVHEITSPAGYRVEWVEREGRRPVTDAERAGNCRRFYCKRRPVMALLRGNGWWLYCDWHMYGSRVTEDGRIVSPRVVPEDDA